MVIRQSCRNRWRASKCPVNLAVIIRGHEQRDGVPMIPQLARKA
jgi:hypothetical protein